MGQQHGRAQPAGSALANVREEMNSYFLNTLINTLPDLVWLKDASGVYLACNQRFEQFFGQSREAIIGKTDIDFIGAEEAAAFRRFDQQAIDSGGPSVNEEWITFASDGHRELVETIKTPMRANQGQLIGVLGVSRNITQRDLDKAALRESESKYRALFESASDGIFLMDAQGLIECNSKAASMFGMDRQELIGGMPADLAPPYQADGRKSVDFATERVSATLNGLPQVFEWLGRHRDGSLIDTEVKLNAVDYQGRRCVQAIVRDISERKRAEALLSRQRQFSDGLIASLPGIFYAVDARGNFVRVNAAMQGVTGYTEAELTGMSALDLFDGRSKDVIATRIAEAFASGSSWAEAELRTKDGREIPYYFTAHIAHFDNQNYLLGLGNDITERRLAEESLRVTASVFHNCQEGILITDADNNITDVNPAFTHITGFSKEDVLGMNPRLLSAGRHAPSFYCDMWQAIKAAKAWRGEIWNRRKNGEVYAQLLSISAIHDSDGQLKRHVGVFSDISHLKAQEARLTQIAYHDALTGLPNRMLLSDRLKQAILFAQREGGLVAVCYIDLDGFKGINDTFGHSVGDQVLIQVANRLGKTIRGGDTVARLGGDEFVVLLLGLQQAQECQASVQRMLASIAQPMHLQGHTVAVGASIGVCIYPACDGDGEALLAHADQAMYIAKRSGKSQFRIWDKHML